MKEISFNIMGGHNKGRSLRFSNQEARNIYLEPDPDGVWDWISYDFYGSKAFVTRTETTTPRDRGMHVFNDELYQVAGTNLYKVNEVGTSTILGTIPGAGRCVFADDGTNIFITTGSRLFRWDGTSVTEITTNVDTPKSIAYLNGFYAVERGTVRGGFAISDSGAGQTFNGLSTGIANSDSDPLMRIIMLDQLLYMVGSRSIEPWHYTGAGNLNFNRLDQALINMGTPATHSVAKDNRFIYFLGSDRHVYRLQGSNHERISRPGISREIRDFSVVSDAIGFTFNIEDQDFYCLTFPDEDKTYLYSNTYNYWVTLSSGVNGARWIGNSYAFCYSRHFIADHRTGSIHELDQNVFDEVGEVRLRRRITEGLTSTKLGLPGNRSLTVGSIYPEMEVGVGTATGQGSDPEIICAVAPDGESFTNERHVKIGVSGDKAKKVAYDQFITGRNIVLRVDITDPVKFVMAGGHAMAKDAGY